MIYIRYSPYGIGTNGFYSTAISIYWAYLPDLTNNLALIELYLYYWNKTRLYILFRFRLIMNEIQTSYQEYLDYLAKYRSRHDKK